VEAVGVSIRAATPDSSRIVGKQEVTPRIELSRITSA
jgi:hypothetical protein